MLREETKAALGVWCGVVGLFGFGGRSIYYYHITWASEVGKALDVLIVSRVSTCSRSNW